MSTKTAVLLRFLIKNIILTVVKKAFSALDFSK